MRIRSIVLLGLALACSACVYAPPQVAVVPAPATPQAQPPANCREFQDTITIDGKPQEAYGMACQQPDGSWRVVDKGDAPAQGGAAPTYYATYPYATYPAYGYYPYYPYYPYPYYYGPPVAVGVGFGFGFHHRCFRCF